MIFSKQMNIIFDLFSFTIGVLLSYHIIVRGFDVKLNKSRILTNITVDASTPSLLLANLTEGVTYTVSVAAANRAGLGPYSVPATLRLDPITKRLDQSSTSNRYLYASYYTTSFILFLFTVNVLSFQKLSNDSYSNDYVRALNSIGCMINVSMCVYVIITKYKHFLSRFTSQENERNMC